MPRVLSVVLLPGRAEIVLQGDREACLRALAERADLAGARVDVATLGSADLVDILAEMHVAPQALSIVDDAIEWPWSTLRDLIGATIDPWVNRSSLVSAAGDEVVAASTAGVTPRTPAAPSDVPSRPLASVLRAAAAATRRPVGAVRRPGPTRRLFVALAHEHGWWMPKHLASLCGVRRRTLYKQLEHVPPAWLRAGAVCLGEPRLRTLVLAEPGARMWDHPAGSRTSEVFLATDITGIV